MQKLCSISSSCLGPANRNDLENISYALMILVVCLFACFGSIKDKRLDYSQNNSQKTHKYFFLLHTLKPEH